MYISVNKIQEAHNKAMSKNGKCLSSNYVNSRDKLKFSCKEGHEWEATYSSVVSRDSWCRKCAIDQTNINNRNNTYSRKKTYEEYLSEAKELASKKNGRCLTTHFEKLAEKFEWKCHVDEHAPWKANLRNIKHNGTWCPQCNLEKTKNYNSTENKIRLILETYFDCKLEPARPKWNRNPLTQYPLELDGYNEEKKIAFEHDGEHHLEKGRFSDKNNKLELVKQKYKDFMKKKNCAERGVTLINIPIPKRYIRNKFFAVLRHVIAHCKPYEKNLTFSLQQMREMKTQFEAI